MKSFSLLATIPLYSRFRNNSLELIPKGEQTLIIFYITYGVSVEKFSILSIGSSLGLSNSNTTKVLILSISML